jgi:hypothetical protein
MRYLFPPPYSSVYLPLRRETELRDHIEHLRQLPYSNNMFICLYTYIREVCVCVFVWLVC